MARDNEARCREYCAPVAGNCEYFRGQSARPPSRVHAYTQKNARRRGGKCWINGATIIGPLATKVVDVSNVNPAAVRHPSPFNGVPGVLGQTLLPGVITNQPSPLSPFPLFLSPRATRPRMVARASSRSAAFLRFRSFSPLRSSPTEIG